MTPPPYLKIFQLIVVIVLFVSCDKKIKPEVKSQAKETIVKVADTDKVAIMNVADTAKITIVLNEEKLEITKSGLDSLKQLFNVLNKDNIEKPDVAYAKLNTCVFDGFEKQRRDFNSESGQDSFYFWYAYFLQQKNGVKPHDVLRKKLLGSFRSINELNKHLQYGGTYFMHQIPRINAYVEYEVYRSIDDDWYNKKYNIDKQKKIFLESLRQHILDEEHFDYDTLGKEKIKRREDLMKIIDEIGSNIITFYDLRKAQEFQYSYYNWL